MSGKGNCFDNAPMESFWGTLKQELVHHRRYRTRSKILRTGGNSRHHRVYRDFLQPAAPTGQTGVPVTCGLCTKILCRTIGSMKGLVSTIDIRPQED
jgi:hypothetical protein